MYIDCNSTKVDLFYLDVNSSSIGDDSSQKIHQMSIDIYPVWWNSALKSYPTNARVAHTIMVIVFFFLLFMLGIALMVNVVMT